MATFRATVVWLVNETQIWTEIITLQRSLQTWGAIIGEEHPSLNLIRRRLIAHESIPGDVPESLLWRGNVPWSATPPRPIYESLSQCGISLEKILELTPLQELSAFDLEPGSRTKMLAMRRGRSQAYLGGYLSFLNQFEKAEEAFQESNSSLQAEGSVEIKLHRMLWHCEHYTRSKKWNDIGPLLRKAHGVFMEPETNSTFVIAHFPDRFRLLCRAIESRLSIDVLVHDVHHHGEPKPIPLGNPVMTPQAPSPVPEVERLFPLQTSDHSTIDVDAWRQFVTFQSPASFSPLPMSSPQIHQSPQLSITA